MEINGPWMEASVKRKKSKAIMNEKNIYLKT